MRIQAACLALLMAGSACVTAPADPGAAAEVSASASATAVARAATPAGGGAAAAADDGGRAALVGRRIVAYPGSPILVCRYRSAQTRYEVVAASATCAPYLVLSKN
ncbi:MAG TPA: hypothetical protein VME42_08360 [Steroidobacteraceae bacterium]|nr:hypothetical protein [Steroidobacteraceae bacterium]